MIRDVLRSRSRMDKTTTPVATPQRVQGLPRRGATPWEKPARLSWSNQGLHRPSLLTVSLSGAAQQSATACGNTIYERPGTVLRITTDLGVAVEPLQRHYRPRHVSWPRCPTTHAIKAPSGTRERIKGRPISVRDDEPSARWAPNHPPDEPDAAQPLPASASAVLASCLATCPCPVRSWEPVLWTGRTNL